MVYRMSPGEEREGVVHGMEPVAEHLSAFSLWKLMNLLPN